MLGTVPLAFRPMNHTVSVPKNLDGSFKIALSRCRTTEDSREHGHPHPQKIFFPAAASRSRSM